MSVACTHLCVIGGRDEQQRHKHKKTDDMGLQLCHVTTVFLLHADMRCT